MDFLGNNSDAIDVILRAISVFGSIVLISITFYYARLARRSQGLVEESQKRVEESQKLVEKLINHPKVVVSLRRDEVNPSCMIVCVENVGPGTALNVRFDPSYSFQIMGETSLGDIGFLKKGIDYFGSGQKYEFLINTIMGAEAWNELMQTPLEIKITYEDSSGEKHVENAYLEFGVFEDVSLVTSPIGAISGTAKELVTVTKEMVKATKDIGKELNQYTRIRPGDKVRTRDKLPAMIDGDYRRGITIPKGTICTVLEVTQEDITIEWDEAPDEEGERVIHRGWRVLSNRFYDIVEIKLPHQYPDLRAGDKVRTRDEFKEAMIDGDYRRGITIPKDAICTVLEVTQEDITIEWDHASDEEGGRVIHRGQRTGGRGRHNQNPHMGRVIHRGQRPLSRRKLEREKIKLPPKQ